ncbi:hypothetical protein CC78DRAFT_547421 [Lojkania enalia]|uniref:F-box domain-containing protein n=1 Tax=Lojkania enalia TaxID=147567 RepID=A0A9P4K3F9_9PLEO|nr:hypothetical protein CC78DRAFT_547421 [Didymosphaeria enalia]
MVASISNIPVELAYRILDFLPSKATLANVSLSSRWWYAAATTQMYHTLEFNHDDPQLEALTSLLSLKPELATHVRHFTLHGDVEYEPLTYVPFNLPSVRSISFHDMHGFDELYDKNLNRTQWETSSCSNLVLQDCEFGTVDIANLIATPAALAALDYRLKRADDTTCAIDLGIVRQALQRHEHCLEELALDYPAEGITWIPCLDAAFAMASFKDFAKLRKIRVAPDFVFGGDSCQDKELGEEHVGMLGKFLPRGIESLEIVHGTAGGKVTEKAVRYVLDRKDEMFTKLGSVVLDGRVLFIVE